MDSNSVKWGAQMATVRVLVLVFAVGFGLSLSGAIGCVVGYSPLPLLPFYVISAVLVFSATKTTFKLFKKLESGELV